MRSERNEANNIFDYWFSIIDLKLQSKSKNKNKKQKTKIKNNLYICVVKFLCMKKGFSLFCAFCLGWMMWNCTRMEDVSHIPEIHFKKLVFLDSIDNPTLGSLIKYAVLTFSFIDGNGDLGVRNPKSRDTLSRIEYVWYKKIDGKYEQYEFITERVVETVNIIDTTIIHNSQIPYNDVMNKDHAQNKILKGTIEIALSAPDITLPNFPKDVDTMRVEFYIFDRALHKSNVEYTPDFSILNPPDEPLLNDSQLIQ
jgi:hypothetical protein